MSESELSQGAHVSFDGWHFIIEANGPDCEMPFRLTMGMEVMKRLVKFYEDSLAALEAKKHE